MEEPSVKETALKVLETFNKVTENPEDYLIPNVHTELLKKLIKKMYDHLKIWKTSDRQHGLPELIIKSFGHEEIWSQLELQNEGQESKLFIDVAKALSLKEKVTKEEDKTSDLESESDLTDLDENEQDANEDVNDEKLSNESLSEAENLEGNETEELESKMETEDKFFNMKEMEKFLNDQDRKEIKSGSKKKIADDSGAESDSSIDLFVESDDDKINGNVRYADFFDSTEACSDRDSTKNDEDAMMDDDSDNELSDVDNSNTKTNDKHLENEQSNLELRELRLKKKIHHLEENALTEKPWQLKGEISAEGRPQNSLLEEILDFDVTARPAIMVTEQTNMDLEDIIIQRIKNRAWDSVKRKVKPVEDLPEFKKKLALDQEKSKQSLAQIYENEFIKQKESLNTDVDKAEQESSEKVECTAAVDNLFSKLDALSHFYFTPRIVKPEVKIISNLPAINMEEVAPVIVSDAALLAPEEIKRKPKGDVKSKIERTDTDKKRERRHKKNHQRKRKLTQEAQEKDKNLPKKKMKKNNDDMLKELTKNRNISQMTMNSSSTIKSSEKFFNQLQDQVKSLVSGKQPVNKKKNSVMSAKKVRL